MNMDKAQYNVQSVKRGKGRKADKARPTEESNQAADVPEATAVSSPARLAAPATDQAAPSSFRKEQHLQPSGSSEEAPRISAGTVRPRAGLEGNARGMGEAGAPVMESLTVDGILTSLEVFEDKSPGPSALIRQNCSKSKFEIGNQQTKSAKEGGKKRGGGLNNKSKAKIKPSDGKRGRSKKSSGGKQQEQ